MTNKIKHYFKKNEKGILVVGIVLLLVVIFFQSGLIPKSFDLKKRSLSSGKEIVEIKATQDTKLQERLYKDLIIRVGPAKAQDDLLSSGLPFTGSTHLLNHIVGDYLYEKFGTKGLVQCKDYFLSSCYHGFILNAIADGGMPRVAETFKECMKYGPSVYSQCSHGIGHGFLANGGYGNLVKALETCDVALRTMEGFPVFNCYDGVFMENIWAVHDGKPSPDRWVKDNDPFYPCNAKEIDVKYLKACWSNQPALAYQLFKGDIGKVAREVCNKVLNTEHKGMCFDGLSRQIHPITNGNLEKTFGLCSLMSDMNWNNYCVSINASAGYSVGDRDLPFKICSNINLSARDECFGRLTNSIKAYKKPWENLKSLCSKLPDETWRIRCES